MNIRGVLLFTWGAGLSEWPRRLLSAGAAKVWGIAMLSSKFSNLSPISLYMRIIP